MNALPSAQWNEEKAAHLMNRAGFGGSPSDVQELADLGLEKAVDRLVDFPVGEDEFPPPTWVKPGVEQRQNWKELKALSEEARMKRNQQYNRLNTFRMFELRAWWLYRMRYDPFPLREKMTLFLHGHFATGQNKVKPAYAHYQQNQMLRTHAGANWKTLVTEVARDPAMLLYLDNAKSSKKKPNENFSRELLELFTLGEGNYSEEDVGETARAFTGWSLNREKLSFQYRKWMHDPGEKTILGRTGNFGGEDVIDLILERPEAAAFLASRLTRFFISDVPDLPFQDALSRVLQKEDFELKPVLKTLFLSEAFYRPERIRSQIKSPVQWLVGMLHQLECPMPPPNRSIRWLDLLGQKLFQPPNVKGWDGGFAWITAASLLHRYNFAGEVVYLKAKTQDPGHFHQRAGLFMEMMNMVPESMEGSEGMASMNAMSETMDQAMNMNAAEAVPAKDGPYGFRPDMLVDASTLLPMSDRENPKQIKERLTHRLFQSRLRPEDEQKLDEFLRTLSSPENWEDRDVLALVHLMMSTPQYQMI